MTMVESASYYVLVVVKGSGPQAGRYRARLIRSLQARGFIDFYLRTNRPFNFNQLRIILELYDSTWTEENNLVCTNYSRLSSRVGVSSCLTTTVKLQPFH